MLKLTRRLGFPWSVKELVTSQFLVSWCFKFLISGALPLWFDTKDVQAIPLQITYFALNNTLTARKCNWSEMLSRHQGEPLRRQNDPSGQLSHLKHSPLHPETLCHLREMSWDIYPSRLNASLLSGSCHNWSKHLLLVLSHAANCSVAVASQGVGRSWGNTGNFVLPCRHAVSGYIVRKYRWVHAEIAVPAAQSSHEMN